GRRTGRGRSETAGHGATTGGEVRGDDPGPTDHGGRPARRRRLPAPAPQPPDPAAGVGAVGARPVEGRRPRPRAPAGGRGRGRRGVPRLLLRARDRRASGTVLQPRGVVRPSPLPVPRGAAAAVAARPAGRPLHRSVPQRPGGADPAPARLPAPGHLHGAGAAPAVAVAVPPRAGHVRRGRDRAHADRVRPADLPGPRRCRGSSPRAAGPRGPVLLRDVPAGPAQAPAGVRVDPVRQRPGPVATDGTPARRPPAASPPPGREPGAAADRPLPAAALVGPAALTPPDAVPQRPPAPGPDRPPVQRAGVRAVVRRP